MASLKKGAKLAAQGKVEHLREWLLAQQGQQSKAQQGGKDTTPRTLFAGLKRRRESVCV